MKRPKRRDGRGFTLIEFLVTMTMLAIITPAITMSFRTALDASARVDQRGEATAQARAVLTTITYDLENAYMPPDAASASASGASATGATTTLPKGWLIGTDSANGNASADTLSFTTLSGRPPLALLAQGQTPADTAEPISRFQQINYSLEPGLQRDTGVLLRAFASPPGEDTTATTDEELLSDQVLALNFEYFDGTVWADAWDTTQPSTSTSTSATAGANGEDPNALPGLPRAIRVTVTLLTASGPQTYTTTVALAMADASTSKIESEATTPQGAAGTPAGGAGTGGTGAPTTP